VDPYFQKIKDWVLLNNEKDVQKHCGKCLDDQKGNGTNTTDEPAFDRKDYKVPENCVYKIVGAVAGAEAEATGGDASATATVDHTVHRD